MKKHSFNRVQFIQTALTSLAILSLILGGLGACSQQIPDGKITGSESTPTQETVASNPAQVNPQIVAANTQFSFKLFAQIHQQQKETNIFISPVSISTALSMTYNGAKEETQEAIAQTLELQGISIEEVNQSNAALKTLLENADPKVKLTIANSLWLNKNATFLPDFLQRISESYGAKLSQLDFQSPHAPSTINDWVKQNTNNKIDKIVDQIDPQTILFLINAIYFKGTWTEPFEKQATTEMPFTLLDSTKKQHPLMSQSGQYRYYETEQFQAISLPYGKGKWSFYVFLPKAGVTLDRFYNSLTVENWEEWMKQFASRQGSIKLPRFKIEYDISLNDTLKALGMEIAFSQQQADFSAMTSEKAFINQVKHKTFVEVNEEGTEAAASTSVGVAATSVPIDPPFNMVVDRPFFSAIRDNQTGTILFMGSIVNPQ